MITSFSSRLLLAATLTSVLPAAAAGEKIAVSENVAVQQVTASNEFGTLQQAANLTNRSGLTGSTHDAHSGAITMWHTDLNQAPASPAPGLPAFPAWLRCEFAQSSELSEIAIWNHNQAGLTNRGFNKTKVYGSTDGSNWKLVTTAELKQGGDVAQIIPLANGAQPSKFKSILIAAESNWGGDVYGLSEIEFHINKQVAEADAPFPTELDCKPQPHYRHRKDGKAGREITLTFSGAKLYGEAVAEVAVTGGPSETIPLAVNPAGTNEARLLLPPGVAVDDDAQVSVNIKRGKHSIGKQVMVPKKRQWTIYIYPHSHVDIGYTNTHQNIELIHKTNLLKGIELAKKTADWPEGSRFVWNPEVTWPIERYLATATPAEKEVVYDAIRKGWVGVDAGYINDNTSVANDEEMFPYVAYKDKLEKATGVKVDSLVQVDVPGMSWGVVPAAAKSGIRYIMPFHNGGDRTGQTNDLNYRPFWWESPDGKSRVLFFQQGSYAMGAAIKGLPYANAIMGQRDPAALKQALDSVKTSQPRANFADKYFMPTTQLLETGSAAPYNLNALNSGFLAYLKYIEKGTYPYDIFVMSWSMADNTPVDQDLPEAVRSWNEDYAYPHIVIAGTHTIMSAFEKKYGDKLPVLRGDFTEYWTDGLGSAAKQTGMNRNTKERLVRADTLWSMLNPGKPAPRDDFNEAWRNVVLGSEHTWAFADPNRQPIQNDILKVKFGYFQTAEDQSKDLEARALAPAAAKTSSTIAVFNTLSWNRSELVTLSAEQSKGGNFIADEAGKSVPSQRLSTGELTFLAKDVPALGAKHYTLTSTPGNGVQFAAATAQGLALDNGLVKVSLDATTGDITSLVMNGREFVDKKAPCALNSYRYLRGGDPETKATGATEVKVSVKEKGPLVASLLVESKAEGCNRLVREVRITAGSPEVACDNLVDKIATTAKEGVHFGFAFDLPGARTRVDIPWGVMEVEKDQLPAGNRNWICFQRWLDVSNSDAGIVWTSLDAPTFEYGKMSANILGAALFSPQWIRELKPSSTIYSWALNNHWHTNFPLSQGGQLPFRYRLLPHAGGYDAAAANRFGTAQAQPLLATPVANKLSLTPPALLDNPRVVVAIVRTEENGKLVLRLRSLSDQPEKTTVTFRNGSKKELTLGPLGMETLTATP